MGWTISYEHNRKRFIDSHFKNEDNQDKSFTCLAKQYKGSAWKGTLWSVWEVTTKSTGEKHNFIRCDILQFYKGMGWGNKDMCESMHPYVYNCPLSYLQMAPVECQAWRDEVIKYHNRYKVLKVGDIISLVGSVINQVEVISLRPLLGKANGLTYKIPRKMIGEKA